MDKKKHIFVIIEGESGWLSWRRDASTFALFVGLIGLGWLLGSGAMQWAGFFVAVVVLISKSGKLGESFVTPDEAITRIREIAGDTAP